MTRLEAARYLGVSKSWIRRLESQGRLSSTRPEGARCLFLVREEVEALARTMRPASQSADMMSSTPTAQPSTSTRTAPAAASTPHLAAVGTSVPPSPGPRTPSLGSGTSAASSGTSIRAPGTTAASAPDLRINQRVGFRWDYGSDLWRKERIGWLVGHLAHDLFEEGFGADEVEAACAGAAASLDYLSNAGLAGPMWAEWLAAWTAAVYLGEEEPAVPWICVRASDGTVIERPALPGD